MSEEQAKALRAWIAFNTNLRPVLKRLSNGDYVVVVNDFYLWSEEDLAKCPGCAWAWKRFVNQKKEAQSKQEVRC